MQEKTKLSRFQAIIIIALILILIAFITYIYYEKRANYENLHKPENGTFASGDGVTNLTYFIFDLNASMYVLYEQRNMIDTGKYEEEENGIFLLKSSQDDTEKTAIFNNCDSVYYVDPEGQVTHFSRISDIPVFINVSCPYRLLSETGDTEL